MVPPPPPIDELVGEGVLIVASGIRLTVKNRAILSILRDGDDYAAHWYRDQVREQLAGFASEKADDAARVERELQASSNPAEVRSARSVDEVNRLVRRTEMLRGLIDRLVELASDDAYVTELAVASRDAAWDEISASIRAAALRRVSAPEPLGEKQHRIALAELRNELDRMRELPPEAH